MNWCLICVCIHTLFPWNMLDQGIKHLMKMNKAHPCKKCVSIHHHVIVSSGPSFSLMERVRGVTILIVMCTNKKLLTKCQYRVAARCRGQICSPVTPCTSPRKSIRTRSRCRKRCMLETRRTDKSQHSALHPHLHHLLHVRAMQMNKKSTSKDRASIFHRN